MMARENQVFKSTEQVSEGRRVIKWNKYPQLTLNLGKAHTWVGSRALAIPSSGRNTGRSAYLTDGLHGKGNPQYHHVTMQLTLHQHALILPGLYLPGLFQILIVQYLVQLISKIITATGMYLLNYKFRSQQCLTPKILRGLQELQLVGNQIHTRIIVIE